jgi:DNA repair protein SbcD/Mre11
MIRVLHLADIHYCPKHFKWVDRAMTYAVDTGVAQGCDLAIIAGDSFDHAMGTHEPAFAAFVRQVVRLSGAMPVVVLQGTHSHDRPGSLDVLKAIPTPHEIIVADTLGVHTVNSVKVATLPSLNKAEAGIMADGAKNWTAKTLSALSVAITEQRGQGYPTILVTHGTVTGCTTESGYAMVSPDHEFSVEALASADCDAVMLGHIHRHQSWKNVLTPTGAKTTIAYPGSLARLVHGHMEPVGFLIWELTAGQPGTFTFHESPSRQLLEIDFPGMPDMDEIRHIAAHAGTDDAVRVRWTVDEEHAAAVDKQAIRDLFAGVDSLKLEPRVLPVQRVRAAGIGRAVTVADKLRHWGETTGSMEALPRLLDRLEMVKAEDPEKIVGRITT